MSWFFFWVAVTGLILFPIRHYRRRSNPYSVARNLLISNLTFCVIGGIASAVALTRSELPEDETLNAARVSEAITGVVVGLFFAAVSFVIFLTLSRRRARKAYKASLSQV